MAQQLPLWGAFEAQLSQATDYHITEHNTVWGNHSIYNMHTVMGGGRAVRCSKALQSFKWHLCTATNSAVFVNPLRQLQVSSVHFWTENSLHLLKKGIILKITFWFRDFRKESTWRGVKLEVMWQAFDGASFWKHENLLFFLVLYMSVGSELLVSYWMITFGDFSLSCTFLIYF